jgi:hypothetical protein
MLLFRKKVPSYTPEFVEVLRQDSGCDSPFLTEKKNEMITMLESEQVIDNIEKLKQELLQFLNFDELTPEILHRLINRIDVKEDGTPVIHYRFAAPTFE